MEYGIITLMERTLTERAYLGEGYFHKFKNKLTGEIVLQECSKIEYDKFLGAVGNAHRATRAGYDWVGAIGGTIKVDSPSKRLGKDEYTVIDGKAHVRVDDPERIKQHRIVPATDIVGGKITL